MKNIMKKNRILILAVILVLVGASVSYKCIGANDLRSKTYDFLEMKGYSEHDVSSIEIKHSFLNKMLSFNEWRIFVTFKSEPDIIFAFTYRNKEIIKQGVTSDDLLDVAEIQKYDDQFENGELKSK